jgi:hypothetical protein
MIAQAERIFSRPNGWTALASVGSGTAMHVRETT